MNIEQEEPQKQKEVVTETTNEPEVINAQVIEDAVDEASLAEIDGYTDVVLSTEAQEGIIQASLTGDINEQLRIFRLMIDGKFLPKHITKPETALTIAQMGKELGINPLQAFHQIISVDGKLTLSAKLQGALLKRGGVVYEIIQYNSYVYLGIDGKAGVTYSQFPLFPTKSEQHEEHFYTRATIIRFTREYLLKSGNIKTVVEEISFTLKDADNQNLLNKNQWVRMQPEMLYARCLSRGANIVGPDLMMGLYGTQEVLDSM